MARPFSKTKAERIEDGSYRKDRHGNLPDLPCGLPLPMRELSNRGREIYIQYGTLLAESGVISTADGIALTEVAFCAELLERCRALLNGQDLVIDDKENPLVSSALKIEASMYKYLTQLGLTSRSRMGLDSQKKQTDDPFASV